MKSRKKWIPAMCCISLLGGCASNQPVSPSSMTIVPNVSVTGTSTSPDSLYQLGRYYQGQNRYDLAISAYRKALAADDGYVEAYNGLGVIYSMQGNYDAAVAEFLTALQKAPQAAHIHSNLGYTYYLQGKYEESIASLTQSTALNPGNSRAQNNLMLAYEKAGKKDTSAFAVQDTNVSDQDEWEQKKILSREASGSIVRVVESPTKLVQVAPSVYELQKTGQPELVQDITRVDTPDVARIGVEVANGNGVNGMAKHVGGYLQHQGYPAARLTNQKPFTVQTTQIQYRLGFEEAARQLQGSLPGQPKIVQRSDLRKDVSLRLVVGRDLAGSKGYFG